MRPLLAARADGVVTAGVLDARRVWFRAIQAVRLPVNWMPPGSRYPFCGIWKRHEKITSTQRNATHMETRDPAVSIRPGCRLFARSPSQGQLHRKLRLRKLYPH